MKNLDVPDLGKDPRTLPAKLSGVSQIWYLLILTSVLVRLLEGPLYDPL